MSYAIVNKYDNKIVMGITGTFTKKDGMVLTDNVTYVDNQIKLVEIVHEIPADFVVNKYSYKQSDGFVLNPDYDPNPIDTDARAKKAEKRVKELQDQINAITAILVKNNIQ